ncbi:twitching motility protein PilT [Streptomyces apocyni]|uniref:twitching motility protein PilT n=1 Tax=Streptomyces apocyni TaxID=2654677 RepID=UPI0012EA85CB|nr:twitching motility protein PilT [Streptomyces apocyni]
MRYTVYDSGALIAAAKNDQRFLRKHSAFLDLGVVPLVPAGVLAQAWDRRPKAAILHRVLQGCRVLPLTERVAKAAADLCRADGSSDVVDASVVLASITHGDAPVLTDDLGDIRSLAAAADRPHVRITLP